MDEITCPACPYVWRPIDTAPRNCLVLLWDAYYEARVGRFDHDTGKWMTVLPYGEERGEIGKELSPILWQPIEYPRDGHG